MFGKPIEDIRVDGSRIKSAPQLHGTGLESLLIGPHTPSLGPPLPGPLPLGKGSFSRARLSTLCELEPPNLSEVRFDTERELRYLVPSDRLKLIENLPGVNIEYIYQHQFPAGSFQKVAESLSPKQAHDLFRETDVRKAVVRGVFCNGQSSYYIQTKSARSSIGGLKIECLEPKLAITRKHFDLLLPLANEGFLQKRRYVANGQVRLADNRSREIALHADIPISAGRNTIKSAPEPISPARMPGFIVEIEFDKRRDLGPLLAGKHSFKKVLEGSVLVSEQPAEIRKILSSSRLGRDGFDQKTADTMSQLLKAI